VLAQEETAAIQAKQEHQHKLLEELHRYLVGVEVVVPSRKVVATHMDVGMVEALEALEEAQVVETLCTGKVEGKHWEATQQALTQAAAVEAVEDLHRALVLAEDLADLEQRLLGMKSQPNNTTYFFVQAILHQYHYGY
jgi:hypothetical protein